MRLLASNMLDVISRKIDRTDLDCFLNKPASRLQVRNSSSNGLVTKLPAGFISGLGQGQIASRQAIVSPYLGDIQLSLSDQRGLLEVEIVRASRLHAQSDSATLPCK